MIAIHPQYVIDENQRKSAVIVPLAEWERIMDEMEELEDIRAYDDAKSKPQDAIPFEQAVREIQQGCTD